MRQPIRLLLVICVGVIVGSFGATAAQAAAPAAVTGAATSITTSGATLNGTIVPNGNAVVYTFQYGTSASYGKTTTPVILPANTKNEAVSALVRGLAPGTTYHYRLVVGTTAPAVYYYPTPSVGADVTFTTNATVLPKPNKGRLTLRSTKLHVKRGIAYATVGCASSTLCSGKLRLTKRIRVGRHKQTVTFGSKSFSIKALKTGTVKIKLSRQAKLVLRFSNHHRTSARLTGRASTGQKGFRRTVTLQA